MYLIEIYPLTLGIISARGLNRYDYYNDIHEQLPELDIIIDQDLQLDVEFGISSPSCDTDNLLKPFKDAISVYYGFSDHRVWRERITKWRVEEGSEYILFDLQNTGTHYWINPRTGTSDESRAENSRRRAKKWEEHKESHNAQRRERRATDPEYRERENVRSKERYQKRMQRHGYRDEHNRKNREEYQSNPDVRQAHQERYQKRASDPVYRAKRNQQARERYHSDPELRQRISDRSKERRAEKKRQQSDNQLKLFEVE